ncbi:MAG: gamma-glutamylcyclotransferase family protein [Solirubrobacteraceae bacterium]
MQLPTLDGESPRFRQDGDLPRGTFVFGYGSLAIVAGLVSGRRYASDGFVADLPGFQRTWGVAMDNRRHLPGYKYYTDDRGRRPEVYVAYLDLRERAQASVNGVCIPVDDGRLAELDARERNYERVDVSDRLGVDGARVWIYAGSAAARRRLAEGHARGRAVIDANYLGLVRNAFRRLGPEEYEACAASLAPGDLPVAELTRVELPPAV